MDEDYFARMESAMDELRGRVTALEDAITKIPQINMQADPSRPSGVVVEPAALTGL